MVVGAGFVPDWYGDSRFLVTAHWLYAGVKHETREMRRVGLAA